MNVMITQIYFRCFFSGLNCGKELISGDKTAHFPLYPVFFISKYVNLQKINRLK